MFGSFLPSLGRQATKVYSGRGADIVMQSSDSVRSQPGNSQQTWLRKSVLSWQPFKDALGCIKGQRIEARYLPDSSIPL